MAFMKNTVFRRTLDDDSTLCQKLAHLDPWDSPEFFDRFEALNSKSWFSSNISTYDKRVSIEGSKGVGDSPTTTVQKDDLANPLAGAVVVVLVHAVAAISCLNE
jgi:hypothetical protein